MSEDRTKFINGELHILMEDGKIPAELIHRADMFLIEPDPPGRVWLNLNLYISKITLRTLAS